MIRNGMAILYNASAILSNSQQYDAAITILNCLCSEWRKCIKALLSCDVDGETITQILAVARLVRVYRILGQCHYRQNNVMAALASHQQAIVWDTRIISCVSSSCLRDWVLALCSNSHTVCQASTTTDTNTKSKNKNKTDKRNKSRTKKTTRTDTPHLEENASCVMTYTLRAGKGFSSIFESIYQVCVCAAEDFDSIRLPKCVTEQHTHIRTRVVMKGNVLECSLVQTAKEENSSPSRVTTVFMVKGEKEVLATLDAKLRLHEIQRR